MPQFLNLFGETYGRLTVVSYSHRDKYTYWNCLCTCGKKIKAASSNLRSGNTNSCGCLTRDTCAGRALKHGLSNSREYRIWNGMLQRCYNPRNPVYLHYGGRGIKVCKNWGNFQGFFKDMGFAISKTHSIDRKNNNGNYCKSNCRWATRKEQARNTRRNHILTVNGESKTLVEWTEQSKITPAGILVRIKKGYSHEEAIFGKDNRINKNKNTK